jgi:hypothetical protein
MTTSERELASASPISKDRRCPVQQSSGRCPVQGKRIDPVELSKIAVHDVDIVEVWRRGLVLSAAPFRVRRRLRDDQYLPRIDMVGISDCAAIAPVELLPAAGHFEALSNAGQRVSRYDGVHGLRLCPLGRFGGRL